jgi:predicted Zn-dependent peptidase
VTAAPTTGEFDVADRPAIGKLRVPKGPRIVEEALAPGVTLIAVRQPRVPLAEVRLAIPNSVEHITRPAPALIGAESIFAGTARHDRASFAMAVERLGGHIGASVDNDRFQVSGAVLAENLSPLLDLVCEALMTASYPVADVRSDRERIADEIVITRSQPEVLAGEALRKRLYAGHPYATGLPTPSTVRRVGAPALRSAHDNLLHRGGAHLVLVGDINTGRAAEVVRQSLGPWLDSIGAPAPPLPPVPSVRPGPFVLVDRPGAVQSNLRLARPAPGRNDPGWPAAALANLAFGGMFASRLVENLRERHGYTYSPHTSISHSRAGSSFTIQAEVATPATAASLVETLYELGRFAVLGVEPAELESARRYSLGTLSYSLATQAGVAGTLARLAVDGMSVDYLAKYAAAISKVQKDEVDAAAASLFAPSGVIGVVLGDAGQISDALARVTPVDVRSLDSD